MKAIGVIENELILLDQSRLDIKKKLDSFDLDMTGIDTEDFVNTVLNGLTTLVKYYTLCWVLEKSNEKELKLLQAKIKEEYIEPLSRMIKEQLVK